MKVEDATAFERFRAEYAAHRENEGRGYKGEALRSLPFLASGPFVSEWKVRVSSYKALLRHALKQMETQGQLDILDLGAGNGWLSYRLAQRGHRCTAVDVRSDTVDGLGAAEELRQLASFESVIAPFEALPLPDGSADVAIFNASLHYATDLFGALAEAQRCVRAGGCIVIMDSPFYPKESDGEAMVREKRYTQGIKFLTRGRLRDASNLEWRRQRVLYPLWYELRPILARLRGARRPSRFDLWTATVS